jgi:hypothetical protein
MAVQIAVAPSSQPIYRSPFVRAALANRLPAKDLTRR